MGVGGVGGGELLWETNPSHCWLTSYNLVMNTIVASCKIVKVQLSICAMREGQSKIFYL